MSVIEPQQVSVERASLTSDELSRYLLQYILSARGVCHENALVLALMRLKVDSNTIDPQWTISDWLTCLNDHVNKINVKLNPLSYKIIRINHGIGKNIVSNKNRQNFGLFETATTMSNRSDVDQDENGNSHVILPESNRFYLYVNLTSSEQTKLATRFSQKEIEFVKWALQKFCEEGNIVKDIGSLSTPSSNLIISEVHRIITGATGNNNLLRWSRYVSFTVGSTQLLQYEHFTAIELESILIKLCEYKWFYRTSQGEYGMDLRCLAELEDYLVSTFGLSKCQNCDKIAVQGVICGSQHCLPSDDRSQLGEVPTELRIWHIDCFQHYISHVSKECDVCRRSLLENGVYMV
ncbi:Smc5-Smc6 complex subunit NSE1 NDAI_0C02390 [Naumovozyma dairenensis CBS 421]|uniref:Non-structural maintenance of chromosomes element 1 homolog n=1 Tax=Naumovozyma dairenensis (strain ATCC 10597 / BCRC 20456 / CBS 421 / NBRC 0211 / NRRL Y-12639) TaxID=1071378 RepID=G0W7Y8_NAUDC|nr:hypothetical protein NDAI_0C02390 [Naumovozyma dairenensis CBS 421]CCD23899.1 hypothetical protein NDAI_0C02390 [Naumovozyma dairenensis CBS 421]